MLVEVTNTQYTEISDFTPLYINTDYIVSISIQQMPRENFYKIRMINGETYTLDQKSIEKILERIT